MTALATGSVELRVAALRRAGRGKPFWQRAGEDLLIAHSSWLALDTFCARALVHVGADHSEAAIVWERAAEVLADAVAGSAPADDLVVLAFAVALGSDQYRLSRMGTEDRRQLLTAIASVVGDWTNDQPSWSSLSAMLRAAVSRWDC